MRKHTHRTQAPGLRADGEANRALRRAYAKGKPWAHEAVQVAAGRMGAAVAAMSMAFGWTGTEGSAPGADNDEELAEAERGRELLPGMEDVA